MVVAEIAPARPEHEWLPRGALAPADAVRVERPALVRVLNLVLRRRLTTVIAGPGCGKTTALAAWAATVASAWYSVDPLDHLAPLDPLDPVDPALSVLFRGVVEALRVHRPELPAAVAARLGAASYRESDEHARAEALAGALAESVRCTCDTDLALIIDDVQDLPTDGASVRFLEALCRQAPPVLHLVLSSRVQLPFPVQRLRGRGQVLELDAVTLALSLAETQSLLAGTVPGGAPGAVPQSLAEHVHRLTAGWPAATRLAAEWLHHHRPDDLAMLVRPGGPVFGYVAEEVLDASDAPLQLLVTTVAPLPRFTLQLCRVLGVPIDDIELVRLSRETSVLRPHPDRPDWYTLGPLIRDVALARLPPEARRRVHHQAMSWFTGNGHLADALGCAAGLGEPALIARFLTEHGAALLAGGAVTELLTAVTGLPGQLRSAVIEQLEGHARLVRGDWRAAQQCLRRAGRPGSPPAPELAWRLCWSHYVCGEFGAAVALVGRAGPDVPTPARALLLGWAASAARRCGDLLGARSLAERALAVATASGDDHALAAAHTAMLLACAGDGDHAGVEAHAVLGLAAAGRVGDLLRTIPILIHRARNYLEQGGCRQSLPELELAVRHAERAGYPMCRAAALETRGRAALGLGRLDEAIADFDASRTAYQRLESPDVAGALLGLGDAYRERGDPALARAAYSEALAWAERPGDGDGPVPVQVLAAAGAGLARVLTGEDPGRAAALATRSVQHARGAGRVTAALAAGWVALELGTAEEALQCARAAVDAAGRCSDRVALAEALELRAVAGPDRAGTLAGLREAASIWTDIGNPVAVARTAVAVARLTGAAEPEMADAERRLQVLGVREPAALAAGLLRAVSAPVRTSVRIRTLGGFDILRDGVPVRLAEWNSKKARDLLKVVIGKHGRPTPREVLIDLLWPAEDPARCANRLSVALSAIRAVLDPAHRYPPDYFVHSDKHVVRLANVRVDVEEFLAAAAPVLDRQLGVPGLEELRGVQALYTGDYLEEDPYEDWAVALREQARAAYLAVTRALADAAGAAGDDDLVVRCCRRVLEVDHYDEAAHLKLVATLTAAGRHGQARACYLSYTHRMAELGIEIAAFPVRPRERSGRTNSSEKPGWFTEISATSG